MSYKGYRAILDFDGCRYDDAFKDKINEIITSMERNREPYTGSFELEIERIDDEIKTTAKKSEGLNDAERLMLDELEKIGTEVSRKGGKPNKVKAEIQVEKEL